MTDTSTPASTSPASTLGTRMLAQVVAVYNTDMNPIQATVFASSFARVAMTDPNAAQELRLRDLATLVADKDHGERLGDIRLYDLCIALMDQRAAKTAAELTPSETAEAEKPAGKKGGKKAAAPVAAAPKNKATPKSKATKPAEPAAAPRKSTGQLPPEWTEATTKIMAAVKKSGTGAKIAALVDASGYSQADTTKMVAKLVEDGKLTKAGKGPGTHYVLPSAAA